MTPSKMAFVALQGSHGKVLEVGSLDVNGSLRNFYQDYTGIDMRSGPGVDKVANGHKLPFSDETFDKVLSLESLEHDKAFWKTMAEMVRVLKPGGKLIITTCGIAFMKHDFPQDYYRFTPEALTELFTMHGMKDISVQEIPNEANVMGYATK